MAIESILAAVNAEIHTLEKAKALLTFNGSLFERNIKPKHHRLSMEARQRIAEAQRRRWAASRKTELGPSMDRM